MSSSKPPVLLVTLLQGKPEYQNASPKELIAGLKRAYQPTVIVGTVDSLMSNLTTTPPPRAVFIQDAGLAHPGLTMHTKALVQYTRNGGTVVVGWDFANHVMPPEMEAFFKQWDLPWKAGSYFRTTFHRNEAMDSNTISRVDLCDKYSAKSLSLRDVAPAHALYTPSTTSHVESQVFPQDFCPVDVKETAIAFARVGKGLFGYSGDVNNEADTTKAHLAMLGLPHGFIPSVITGPGRFALSVGGGSQNDAGSMAVYTDAIKQAGGEMHSGVRIGNQPPMYAPSSDLTASWRQKGGGVPQPRPNACQACGKDAPLQCGRCKKVKYCGAAHQKQDWKNHKAYCKAL
ncbi:hypothetical protein BDZ89DRAFT_1156253 [Hymenopellis radicata]|nr:hypothetical protein BDZ89DRAFT_1156253 [Hymenopellis radicata]